MTTREFRRRSAARVGRRFGHGAVTIERGSVALTEFVSGAVPALACGVALEDATSLPLASAVTLSGRLDPGATLAIAGHALTYTVQATAEPIAGDITVSIDPGIESDVNGEAVTPSARSLAFTGGQIELDAAKIAAGWTVGAQDEIWALVPPDTDGGKEPRDGDRMTAPFAARIGRVGGRERIEYVAIITPTASAEAI